MSSIFRECGTDFDEDTTVPAVRPFAKKNKHIHLVKNIIARGPSGAIRSGIARASAPRVLVTMADLCDDLSQVKDLIKLVPDKAGIAAPSRYMKGGGQELKSYTLKVLAPRSTDAARRLLEKLPEQVFSPQSRWAVTATAAPASPMTTI